MFGKSRLFFQKYKAGFFFYLCAQNQTQEARTKSQDFHSDPIKILILGS